MDRSKMTWLPLKFSNETELENLLTKKRIFEDCSIFEAKPSLNVYKGYNRFADILIVENNHKYWSIGEVEVSSHSFSKHVYPQLVEIKSLIDINRENVNQQYLSLEGFEYNKKLRDLIRFNKPFLTLITDNIPDRYTSVIPLLNSFCNLRTVNRYKNLDEEYVYITKNTFVENIKTIASPSYLLDNCIFVDYPNLVNMHTNEIDHISYEGTRYQIYQQVKNLNGFENLFWYVDGHIRNGKYKLILKEDSLTLKK